MHMVQKLKKVLRILGSRREVLLSALKNKKKLKKSVKLMKNFSPNKKTFNATMMLCFRTCSQWIKAQKATFFLESFISKKRRKIFFPFRRNSGGDLEGTSAPAQFWASTKQSPAIAKKNLHFFGQIYEALSGVIRRSYSKKSLWYANQKCTHNTKKQGAFQSTEKKRVRFLRESALWRTFFSRKQEQTLFKDLRHWQDYWSKKQAKGKIIFKYIP